jgi:hypothetical protein
MYFLAFRPAQLDQISMTLNDQTGEGDYVI